MSVTKAVVTRLGWDEREKFSARIEFPDGPPDWPISVGWGDRPIYISLDPPAQHQDTTLKETTCL